jgi:hypothetical protein
MLLVRACSAEQDPFAVSPYRAMHRCSVHFLLAIRITSSGVMISLICAAQTRPGRMHLQGAAALLLRSRHGCIDQQVAT